MIKPPPTIRVFIVGVSGSGKSTAAWRLYLERFPRRILIDQTGEWEERADIVVYDTQEFSWALRKYAPLGRWTICFPVLDDTDFTELVDYLIPVPDTESSPVRLMHGAVILVDEIDLIAPPRTSKREVRTLMRRSRHAGLSVVTCTQRPESVSREVSAQSDHILCMHLVEPDAFDYMGKIMRVDLRTALPEWIARHPHGGLWRAPLTGKTLWLTESGELVAAREPEPEPERAAAGAAVLPSSSRGDGGAGPEEGQEEEEEEPSSL